MADFLGVAFLAEAFFLVAGFLAVVADGAADLTTRPVFVLVRTTGAFSSTAGAWLGVNDDHLERREELTAAGVLRALDLFAVVLLCVVVLFLAGAFFVAVVLFLVAAFAGAFLVAVAVVVVFAFAGALVAVDLVVDLVEDGAAAPDFLGIASFTGPEGPGHDHVSVVFGASTVDTIGHVVRKIDASDHRGTFGSKNAYPWDGRTRHCQSLAAAPC